MAQSIQQRSFIKPRHLYIQLEIDGEFEGSPYVTEVCCEKVSNPQYALIMENFIVGIPLIKFKIKSSTYSYTRSIPKK